MQTKDYYDSCENIWFYVRLLPYFPLPQRGLCAAFVDQGVDRADTAHAHQMEKEPTMEEMQEMTMKAALGVWRRES